MPAQLKPYRSTRIDTLLLSAFVSASCAWQIITRQFAPALVTGTSLTALILSAALMGIGFLLVFIGCVWKGTNHVALSIEMVGRTTLILPALAYGLLVYTIVGSQVLISVGFLLALSVSSTYRAMYISRQLRRLHRGLLLMSEENQEES